MDRLDVRILGDLLGVGAQSPGIRRPLRSIARDLGVDENTVRTRLSRLRASGFLKGWLISVNPTLLGAQVTQAWLDVPPAKDKAAAIRDLSLIDGVGLILDYYGTALSVHLYWEEDRTLRKNLELLGRIAGTDKVESARISFPPTRMVLSKQDWRILLSLHRNPWKPFTEIAEEVGVSSATVRRRIARMNHSDALSLLVEIDPKATEGSLLAHLTVFYDADASRRVVEESISKNLGDEIAFAEVDNPDHGFFALMLTNVARVREILRWLGSRPGVRRARVDILQDVVSFPELHESLIERGLRGTAGQ